MDKKKSSKQLKRITKKQLCGSNHSKGRIIFTILLGLAKTINRMKSSKIAGIKLASITTAEIDQGPPLNPLVLTNSKEPYSLKFNPEPQVEKIEALDSEGNPLRGTMITCTYISSNLFIAIVRNDTTDAWVMMKQETTPSLKLREITPLDNYKSYQAHL